MRRLKKVHSVTLYGFTGTGDSPALARAEAIRKSEAAAGANYNPMHFSRRGMVVIVYRDLDSYCLATLVDAEGKCCQTTRDGTVWGGSYGGSREEVRSKALVHLFSQTWVPADGLDLPAELIGEGDYVQSEYLCLVAYYLAHHQIKGEALSENARHERACRLGDELRQQWRAARREVARLAA